MLDARLRSHVDSLAEPVELAEVLARSGAGQDEVELVPAPASPLPLQTAGYNPMSNRWFAAAATIAFVLLGAVWLISTLAEAPTLLAVDEASNPLPELPDSLADASWRKVPEPFRPLEEGNAVVVNSATVADGVAWAAGIEWRIDFSNGRIDARKRGAIWRSDDGEAWEVVDGNFGSLDLPGGNWAPSGITLEHIVAAADGVLWAFGNEFRDTVAPVGYRSVDGGSSWQSVSVPSSGEMSQLVDASIDGNTVLVVIIDDGLDSDEQTRVLTTVDGASWETEHIEATSPSRRLTAVQSAGELIYLRSADTPDQTSDPFQIVARPGHVVASGAANRPGDALGNAAEEVVEGEPFADRGALWQSADGSGWSTVPREERDDVSEREPRLFAHRTGVLAAIEWVSDGVAGVSLLNIEDDNSVAQSFGDLPSATFTDMFVLNGTYFFIGSEDSAALDESAEEDASIWVASAG